MIPLREAIGVVLDASALLAFLNQEEGAEQVAPLPADAVISTVNLAEVMTRLALTGMPDAAIRDTMALLPLKSVLLDLENAIEAGLLRFVSRVFWGKSAQF